MPASSDDMTIDLHCFVWHDQALLPLFLKQHAAWADHVHVWALGSSQDDLAAVVIDRSKVSVHPYGVEGGSAVNTQRLRFDHAWQLSTGQADWVVMLHVDEQLHHSDLLAYLRGCERSGVTAVRAIGVELVTATQGCRSPALDRLVAFSPAALTATNFTPGEHHAWPEGHVVWPAAAEVLLLRHQLLDADRFVQTCRTRAADLLPGDRDQRWAEHLDWNEEQLLAHIAKLQSRAKPVPGLGPLADLPPEDYRRDERMIERSGLLDIDWYEARNPDIAEQQFDALTHYCEYGWREARPPNDYFDPAWYAAAAAPDLHPDQNPLLHYILVGELTKLKPSPHFDPEWYRTTYRIDAGMGALAHYLAHRLTGHFSPVPSFDVQAYVAQHPEVLTSGVDPYLHHLGMTGAMSKRSVHAPPEPVPRWDQLLDVLSGPPIDDAADTPVPLRAVQDVVREFLPWLPFDEAWYLKTNADVADAVNEGVFASAHAHFIEHGFFEGRAPLAGAER